MTMNRNKHQQVGKVVFGYRGIADGVPRWQTRSGQVIREDILKDMNPVEIQAPAQISLPVSFNYEIPSSEEEYLVWMRNLRRRIAISIGTQICDDPELYNETDFFLMGDSYSQRKYFEGTLTLKEVTS